MSWESWWDEPVRRREFVGAWLVTRAVTYAGAVLGVLLVRSLL